MGWERDGGGRRGGGGKGMVVGGGEGVGKGWWWEEGRGWEGNGGGRRGGGGKKWWWEEGRWEGDGGGRKGRDGKGMVVGGGEGVGGWDDGGRVGHSHIVQAVAHDVKTLLQVTPEVTFCVKMTHEILARGES